MFSFTFRKAMAFAAVFAAISMGVAGPAGAAGNKPSFYVNPAECWMVGPYNSLVTHFSITAANLYPDYQNYVQEIQTVYVREELYSYKTRTWAVTDWIRGEAYDTSGPIAWYNDRTGQYLGNGTWTLMYSGFPVGSGQFQVAVQFKWDRSTAGAASGFSDWIWEPGICNF